MSTSTDQRSLTHSHRDMWTAVAAALLCAAMVIAIPYTAVRAVFAVPLCLVLPGYALSAAAFAHRPVRGPQRLMLVLSLSLSVLAVGAVLLDVAPGGLRLASWAALLLLVVVAGCIAAVVRRRAGLTPAAVHWSWPRLRRGDLVLLGIAAVVIAGALSFSRVLLPAPNAIGYTQLWMLPTGSRSTPTLRIGVRSAEQHRSTYRLVLAVGSGRPVPVTRLTLRPGAASEINVPLSNAPRTATIVAAELYKLGSRGIYRQVTAVVGGPRGSARGHGRLRGT